MTGVEKFFNRQSPVPREPAVANSPKPTLSLVEPEWLRIARSQLGKKEVPGGGSNPDIERYFTATNLGICKDDTPWCSAFACWCMERAGIKSPQSAWARTWLLWGQPLVKPKIGCIVVLSRGSSGHVGFFVGQGEGGVKLLGGNQHDEVCEADFEKSRVLGYRWPGNQ